MTAPVGVVTGDSRGLGAALVSALVRRGFSVAGCANSASPPDEVVLHRAVDVGDPGAIERFADEVAAGLGPIDLWINNAAVAGPIGALRTSSYEEWRRAITVNLLGVVAGTRAFLSRRATPHAVLVNIASRAGRVAVPGLSAYGATKAAVISLTMSVAEEERRDGLRAYVVIPPSIDTDLQDLLLGQDPETYPGALDARRRRDDGLVVSAAWAANAILAAVLDRPSDGVVIDLMES